MHDDLALVLISRVRVAGQRLSLREQPGATVLFLQQHPAQPAHRASARNDAARAPPRIRPAALSSPRLPSSSSRCCARTAAYKIGRSQLSPPPLLLLTTLAARMAPTGRQAYGLSPAARPASAAPAGGRPASTAGPPQRCPAPHTPPRARCRRRQGEAGRGDAASPACCCGRAALHGGTGPARPAARRRESALAARTRR
jgi:hypothetical protein